MPFRSPYGPLTVSLQDAYELTSKRRKNVSRHIVNDANEIVRRSLLDRLDRVHPAILALIAPAGYGKSALMQQYLERAKASAVCDCGSLRGDLDLARRIVSALRVLAPENQRLVELDRLLGDGGISIVERIDLALDAWQERHRGTFVFENAEAVFESPPGNEFFARLLSRRPEGRSIVVCSRSNVRAHLTRFAAPHEIVVLRAADLAFDAAELRETFDGLATNDLTFEQIIEISRGWPIVVLLMKRFATEGRLQFLINRLDDSAFTELHDYISDEILAPLGARLTNAIFACAAIPRASRADIEAALADADIAEKFADFARESPFIDRAVDGTFSVHPLLASWMLSHREERRLDVLRRVAQWHENAGTFERAAELYSTCGDRHAAAEALGAHELLRDSSPSRSYQGVLRTLDRALIARHPRLWAASVLYRVFCVDTMTLIDEAESLMRTLPQNSPAIERAHLAVMRAILKGHVGGCEEAIAILDEIARDLEAADDRDQALSSYIAYSRSLQLARLGRLQEAERDIVGPLRHLDRTDTVASTMYLALGADIARAQGARAVEFQFLERSLERARASKMENFIAPPLAECVISAWLAGDQERFKRQGLELQALVERCGVQALSFLAKIAGGESARPGKADLPKYVAYAWMMAAASASDPMEAMRAAHFALEAAEQCAMPFVQTLAALAGALLDDVTFDEHIAIAQSSAARCESPALQRAVAAIARHDDDAGMLQSFVLRFSRERSGREAPLHIRVASGSVTVSGRSVSLSDRELELLVALTLRRDPTPRSRVAAMLWPDLEEDAARNALSVCLHRLRKNLGRDDLVVRDGDGYRLHASALVDLWEIDRVVATQRQRESLGETDRSALRRVWTQLRDGRPARVARWEWFGPTERRLDEVRVEVAQRLGTDALKRGDARSALEFAADMIAHDPCDEPAHELAIRAHLLAGDRAAAMRQFRQYRDTLLAELQCEPSASLAALMLDT